MERNANILKYVEKYKHKYGISYLDKNSSAVKKIVTAIKVFLIYIVIFLPIMEWSLLLNAQKVAHTTDNFSFASINKSTYAAEFYIILVSIFVLFALLFFIKKRKALSVIALLVLPIANVCFATCTENRNGFGYKPAFYFLTVPAVITSLLIIALLFILIRAHLKTKKLYDMIVSGLYKQYGNTDGVKMSDQEWEEFLSSYNPYQQITKDDSHKPKD